jgi:hypothetical protein
MRALAASRRALGSTVCPAASTSQRAQPQRPSSRPATPPPTAAAGQPQQPSAAPPPLEQAALQASYFDDREAQVLQASITPDVDARLARVAAAIPGLSPASRVLDAGAGTGALIPHLQARKLS